MSNPTRRHNGYRPNPWFIFLAISAFLFAGCNANGTGVSRPSPTITSAMPGKPSVTIVGHRGAAGVAPENTLAGFQKAMEIGVDAIELDVHLSKDNELVVIHDPTVVRTTDGTGAVRDLVLAELKQLNAAAKFKGSGNYGIQRIPTLQEVYDLVGQRTRIQVEIKLAADGSRYPEIEQKVIDLVRRNNALAFTDITSFAFRTLQQVQSLEPRLGRRVPVSTAYLRDIGMLSKGPPDVAADISARGIPWIDVEKTYMSLPMFTALKQSGLKTGVWVVNDVQDMWRFIDMGVDSITTDRPDLLVPAYRQRESPAARPTKIP